MTQGPQIDTKWSLGTIGNKVPAALMKSAHAAGL